MAGVTREARGAPWTPIPSNISIDIFRTLFLVSLINTLVLFLDPEDGTQKDMSKIR